MEIPQITYMIKEVMFYVMYQNLLGARRSRSVASIALGPLSITAASGAQHKSGSRGTIRHRHFGSNDGLLIGSYRHSWFGA